MVAFLFSIFWKNFDRRKTTQNQNLKFVQKLQKKLTNFEKKYINLLKAGGSKNYNELLKPLNLDITKKVFWRQSISVLNNLIDELESII